MSKIHSFKLIYTLCQPGYFLSYSVLWEFLVGHSRIFAIWKKRNIITNPINFLSRHKHKQLAAGAVSHIYYSHSYCFRNYIRVLISEKGILVIFVWKKYGNLTAPSCDIFCDSNSNSQTKIRKFFYKFLSGIHHCRTRKPIRNSASYSKI